MERLRQLKERVRRGGTGLIPYITAGDPDPEQTVRIMHALADNGADVLELGLAFSDPVADGPVIQRAARRALDHGIGIPRVLEMIREFRRQSQIPVVLMGYMNPVFRYGPEAFVRDLSRAGGDGLIVADLPYEEGEQMEKSCARAGVSLIYLLAPEISSERTRRILASTRGFVYCLSQYSTTGSGKTLKPELKRAVHSIREGTDLPVAVGFGVSSIKRAVAVSRYADAIVFGSWLISHLEKSTDRPAAAASFMKKLRSAVNGRGSESTI